MTAYRGIVQESCSWQLPIANQVTVPTGTEAKGTRYIVKAVATGVFTGKETYVATAKILNPTLLTDWYFDLPVAGWALWDDTLNKFQVFDWLKLVQQTLEFVVVRLHQVNSE